MKFSLIVPVLNGSRFIKQCIDSITSQDGNFEIEIIVRDGKSTDGTVGILEEYSEELKKDKRISFMWKSEKDKGQSDAINNGLAESSGDILAYLNADDVYLPGAFSAVAEAFLAEDTDWITGQCLIIDENGKEKRQLISTYKNFWLKHFSRNVLFVLNPISQPATFWSRKAWKKIGSFDIEHHLVMDYDYWCRLSGSYKLKVLNKKLASFRSYADNKSSRGFVLQFNEELKAAHLYTNSKFLLKLHYLHICFIVLVYKLSKVE